MARVLLVAWQCGYRSRIFLAERTVGAAVGTVHMERGDGRHLTDRRTLVAGNNRSTASGSSYATSSHTIDDGTDSRASGSVEAGAG